MNSVKTTLGKDTVYSVAVILDSVGLRNIDGLSTDAERFDFIDSNFYRIDEYFYERSRIHADIDQVRLAFNHGIREIQGKGWPIS